MRLINYENSFHNVTRLHLLTDSDGARVCVGRGDDISDYFHNCVRESEKALLVPVPTKGITTDHERGNSNSTVNKSHAEFNDFVYCGLDTISLRTVRIKERRLYVRYNVNSNV